MNKTKLHKKREARVCRVPLKSGFLGTRRSMGTQTEVRQPEELHPSSFSQAEVPAHLVCPITYEMFGDPVLAPDGFTYERKAITEWITRYRCSSPTTRETLAAPCSFPTLIPNTRLLAAVGSHVAATRMACEVECQVSGRGDSRPGPEQPAPSEGLCAAAEEGTRQLAGAPQGAPPPGDTADRTADRPPEDLVSDGTGSREAPRPGTTADPAPGDGVFRFGSSGARPATRTVGCHVDLPHGAVGLPAEAERRAAPGHLPADAFAGGRIFVDVRFRFTAYADDAYFRAGGDGDGDGDGSAGGDENGEGELQGTLALEPPGDERALADDEFGHLRCPITKELFVHPVMCRANGRSYERRAVEQWLQWQGRLHGLHHRPQACSVASPWQAPRAAWRFAEVGRVRGLEHSALLLVPDRNLQWAAEHCRAARLLARGPLPAPRLRGEGPRPAMRLRAFMCPSTPAVASVLEAYERARAPLAASAAAARRAAGTHSVWHNYLVFMHLKLHARELLDPAAPPHPGRGAACMAPSAEIDAMWRAHRSLPELYLEFCDWLTGRPGMRFRAEDSDPPPEVPSEDAGDEDAWAVEEELLRARKVYTMMVYSSVADERNEGECGDLEEICSTTDPVQKQPALCAVNPTGEPVEGCGCGCSPGGGGRERRRQERRESLRWQLERGVCPWFHHDVSMTGPNGEDHSAELQRAVNVHTAPHLLRLFLEDEPPPPATSPPPLRLAVCVRDPPPLEGPPLAAARPARRCEPPPPPEHESTPAQGQEGPSSDGRRHDLRVGFLCDKRRLQERIEEATGIPPSEQRIEVQTAAHGYEVALWQEGFVWVPSGRLAGRRQAPDFYFWRVKTGGADGHVSLVVHRGHTRVAQRVGKAVLVPYSHEDPGSPWPWAETSVQVHRALKQGKRDRRRRQRGEAGSAQRSAHPAIGAGAAEGEPAAQGPGQPSPEFPMMPEVPDDHRRHHRREVMMGGDVKRYLEIASLAINPTKAQARKQEKKRAKGRRNPEMRVQVGRSN